MSAHRQTVGMLTRRALRHPRLVSAALLAVIAVLALVDSTGVVAAEPAHTTGFSIDSGGGSLIDTGP